MNNTQCDEEGAYEAFVEDTAREVLGELSEEDMEYMRSHPVAEFYHFSLGLYVRNRYIYGREHSFYVGEPDNTSDGIVRRILELISEEESN